MAVSLQRCVRLTEPVAGVVADDTPVTCVIHNDDVHTYDEVAAALRTIFGLSPSVAAALTEEVDRNDQAVPGPAAPFSKLHVKLVALKATGLLYSAQPAWLRSAQPRSVALLGWLTDLCGVSDAASWLVGEAAAEALEPAVPAEPSAPPPASAAAIETLEHWLGRDRASIDAAQGPSVSLALVQLVDSSVFQSKANRKALFSLFTVLLKHASFRAALGLAFGTAFPRMMTRWADGVGLRKDSILDLSVQLYTVPSVGVGLFARGEMPRGVVALLWRVLSVAALEAPLPALLTGRAAGLNLSSADNRLLGPAPLLNVLHHLVVHDRSSPLCQALIYLVRPAGAANGVLRDPVAVALLSQALRFVTGMDPQTRMTRGHVEFESATWRSAFQIALQLSAVTSTLLDAISVGLLEIGAPRRGDAAAFVLPDSLTAGDAAVAVWTATGCLVEHAAAAQALPVQAEAVL